MGSLRQLVALESADPECEQAAHTKDEDHHDPGNGCSHDYVLPTPVGRRTHDAAAWATDSGS